MSFADSAPSDVRRRDLPLSLRGKSMLQVRDGGDGGKTPELCGYGAVFYRASEPGSEYWLWNDLVERLMPGCFDRALKEDDVRSFFNHDADTILGRRAFQPSDTLQLSVDEIGLRFCVPFDGSDPDHVRIFPKVRSGKVTGSSFMFVPTAETYRSETDANDQRIDIIEVNEVRLWEVGPVVFPAYDAATSEVRRRMSGNLTSREREARDRRQSAGGDADRQRLRLRMACDDFARARSSRRPV